MLVPGDVIIEYVVENSNQYFATGSHDTSPPWPLQQPGWLVEGPVPSLVLSSIEGLSKGRAWFLRVMGEID